MCNPTYIVCSSSECYTLKKCHHASVSSYRYVYDTNLHNIIKIYVEAIRDCFYITIICLAVISSAGSCINKKIGK